MVPGDVVVDLLPDTFDAAVLGRIGRQEVQHELASRGLDEGSGPLARVDAEVVDDDVQPPVAPVAAQQRGQRRDEQVAALASAEHPRHARADRQRASDVALVVVAGREHTLLPTAPHPVEPEPRVEVDIHLLGVEGDLVAGQVTDELADRADPAALARLRPRAADDGAGALATRSHRSQEPTDVADAQAQPGVAFELQRQQLTRSRRPCPAEVLRARVEQVLKSPPVRCRNLALTVVRAMVA